jgi:hypothetical protein
MKFRPAPTQPGPTTATARADDQVRAELRELLERQRAELEGHMAETERLAAETRAQAEAEIEQLRHENGALVEQHREAQARAAGAETKLEESEAHATELQRKLAEAEQRAADAERKLKRADLKPRAARKLGEARREAEAARAEAERRRQELTRLERELGELEPRAAQLEEIQRTLEEERTEREAREADLLRRVEEAGAEHAREHRRRVELEQRLGAELAALDDRQRIERQLKTVGRSETNALPSDLAITEPTPGEPPTDPDEAGRWVSRGRRPRFARRWRRRASLPCAVCSRPPAATTDSEAAILGWTVTGAGALCPACQRKGWSFPPGATVPFRSLGAGDRSSSRS